MYYVPYACVSVLCLLWLYLTLAMDMFATRASPEASLGPYAWQSRPLKRVRSNAKPSIDPVQQEGCNLQHLPLESEEQRGDVVKPSIPLRVWEDRYLLHPELANLPRAKEVFRKIECDHSLSLMLPKPGVTPGRVLEHCVEVFEKLHARMKPMTFKFGFTHDAAVRWHNSVFGYKFSKDPFDYMLIIYGAGNPHGPAFLEAALIDRFGSSLFVLCSMIFSIVLKKYGVCTLWCFIVLLR